MTPPTSSNIQGQYFYTTQRACTSATTSSLFAVIFSSVGCTPQGTAGGYYATPVCANNGTIISKTGGFLALQYYPTSRCDTTPTSTSFVQLNVCGNKRSSSDFFGRGAYAKLTLNTSKITSRSVFSYSAYGVNDPGCQVG